MQQQQPPFPFSFLGSFESSLAIYTVILVSPWLQHPAEADESVQAWEYVNVLFGRSIPSPFLANVSEHRSGTWTLVGWAGSGPSGCRIG